MVNLVKCSDFIKGNGFLETVFVVYTIDHWIYISCSDDLLYYTHKRSYLSTVTPVAKLDSKIQFQRQLIEDDFTWHNFLHYIVLLEIVTM